MLAITHEEIVALHASQTIRSYRDLPQIWYHIQIKERDEPRPQGGVLRTREFTMKDSYTLDRDQAGLDAGYAKHEEAYDRIYTRCGLDFYKVESDTGHDGRQRGARVHGAVAARARIASRAAAAATTPPTSRWPSRASSARPSPPQRAASRRSRRPAWRRSTRWPQFLGIDAAHDQQGDAGRGRTTASVWLALVRGDRRLHELKLAQGAGAGARAPATPEEIEAAFGAKPGSIGAGRHPRPARSAGSWPTRRCARAPG